MYIVETWILPFIVQFWVKSIELVVLRSYRRQKILNSSSLLIKYRLSRRLSRAIVIILVFLLIPRRYGCLFIRSGLILNKFNYGLLIREILPIFQEQTTKILLSILLSIHLFISLVINSFCTVIYQFCLFISSILIFIYSKAKINLQIDLYVFDFTVKLYLLFIKLNN